MRSDAMTVGADDVAFRDLSLKHGAILQKDLAGTEVEEFLTWVPVIKIHGVWGKAPTTVQARDTSELTKPFKSRSLAAHHALNLGVAMARVVDDVVRALISRTTHGPF